jgi:hemolysin activation/secretion protein
VNRTLVAVAACISGACATPLFAQTFFGTLGVESATGVERGSTALVMPVDDPTTFLTLDRFGSADAGPLAFSLAHARADVLRKGDQVDLIALAAGPGRTRNAELGAVGLGYRIAVGPDLTAYFNGSLARAVPDGPLTAGTGIEGGRAQVALGVRRDISPAPDVRLSQIVELRARETGATSFGTTFLDERVQSVFIGIRRTAGRPLGQQSRLGAALSAGVADFGASATPAALASDPGASDTLLRFSASAEGSLPLRGPWAINAGIVGQVSRDSLPVSQKCGFETNAYSRGFDISELLGDSCIAGRGELAANLGRPRPGNPLWVQAFAGIDGGRMTLNENDLRDGREEEWSSVNLGVRALAADWVAEISLSDVRESPGSATTPEGEGRRWFRAALRF